MSGAEPYAAAGAILLRETGCIHRRVRSSLSGRAYTGSPDWEIDAPNPRTPPSFFVFAHEIGHQVLHRTGSVRTGLPALRRLSRWEQEVEADEYAAGCFDRFGLPGKEPAIIHQGSYLAWTVRKSLRRARDPRDTARTMDARIARGALAPLVQQGVRGLLAQHYGEGRARALGL